MTVVKPTLQKPNPASLREVLYALERMILKNLNCVRPGKIVAFHPGDATHGPTADVEVAQNQVAAVAPDGTNTIQQIPVILSAPVWFMGGGTLTVTTPIAEGDECIILFNDREIDNWLHSGSGTIPTTARLHSISDGIVLVGLRSNPRGLANISTTALQIRTDDGASYFELGIDGHITLNTAGTVAVNAGTVDVTAETTTINGDLVVTGTIEADGNITGSGINLDTHVHTGVQSGPDETGGPV